MDRSKTVMVFIELSDGRVADVSLELVSEARRLADRLGGRVEAVAAGWQIEEALEELGPFGCDRVYFCEDERLTHFTSLPWSRFVTDVIRREQPGIVLFGATTTGRDVAPRVASALRCGLTADCTELAIGDHRIKDRHFKDILLQIRPAFGGNIIATIVSPESCPSMATVREGVMKLSPPEAGRKVALAAIPCGLTETDFPSQVLEIVRHKKQANLKAFQVIVSAGMGAGDPESLDLVAELARVLGGEVGCSRPVADACLLPREHQVGQTGTTVRPALYIACGISGQIQHRAGMSESSRIIAVNRDPHAPIFSIAHYGIVGDVRDVLPRMIKAFKEKL